MSVLSKKKTVRERKKKLTMDALSKYINNAENVKRPYFFFILRSLSACVPSFPSVIVSPMPISKSKRQQTEAA